jgi:hypothetical protein
MAQNDRQRRRCHSLSGGKVGVAKAAPGNSHQYFVFFWVVEFHFFDLK